MFKILLNIACILYAYIYIYLYSQDGDVVMAINPLLLAAIPQVSGGLINAFIKPPELPDLFTPAVQEAARARGRVQELLSNQNNTLESALAATGATGSAGAGQREALIRASTGAVSDIDAKLADIITNAGNQQRRAEFENALMRYNSRQQAVSQLANVGTSLVALNSLQNGGVGNVPTTSGPTPTELSLLNTAAQGARTLPEDFQFDTTGLTPRVDPSTGRITFGGV